MPVITPRDLRLVEFVSRFDFVTTTQVCRWLSSVAGGSAAMRVTNRRLAVLIGAGLLEHATVLSEHGRVVWATHEGLRAAGVTGSVHPPRIGQARHDKIVADLALTIMIDKPTHHLVTEREMRRDDTRNGATTDAPLWVTAHTATSARRVYPDLLSIAPSGSRVVHEVELSGKAHLRLTSLMLSHLANDAVGSIRYYASSDAINGVTKAAEQARQIAGGRGNQKVLLVLGLPG